MAQHHFNSGKERYGIFHDFDQDKTIIIPLNGVRKVEFWEGGSGATHITYESGNTTPMIRVKESIDDVFRQLQHN